MTTAKSALAKHLEDESASGQSKMRHLDQERDGDYSPVGHSAMVHAHVLPAILLGI